MILALALVVVANCAAAIPVDTDSTDAPVAIGNHQSTAPARDFTSKNQNEPRRPHLGEDRTEDSASIVLTVLTWTPWLVLLAWLLIGAGLAATVGKGTTTTATNPARVAVRPTPIGLQIGSPPIAGDVDRATLSERLDHNVALFHELLRLFSKQAPQLLAEIHSAIAAADSKRAELAAHSLRGALANLAADQSAHVALQLEEQAHDGDLHGAATTLVQLETEVARASESLEALAESQAPFGDVAAA